MTSPTIYGYPSAEWNLPDDMAGDGSGYGSGDDDGSGYG